MATVFCIGGVLIGSSYLENRLNARGNPSGAKTVKTFLKFFLIGSGGYLVYLWGTAAAALIL